MLLPAIGYIAWDIFFTSKSVWSFNNEYIIGIKLVNLPVEEVLFFFVVPYCCLFIYECIGAYFSGLKIKAFGNTVLKLLALLLFITGIIFYNRYYTAWAFIFTALFIALIYLLRNYFRSFNATVFVIAYIIILIPFLLVNGFLTALPVVLYNNAENLSIRLYTIPVEDIFYGMLLILLNVMIYEKLKERR